MRTVCRLIVAAFLAICCANAQLKELRPGWNLFSVQQDVQLGKEAAAEMERQAPVVHNRQVDDYLNVLLRKLQRSSYARTLNRDGSRGDLFPFTIRAVAEKKINAFSLPGGPVFVNTGVFEAADNEAQLAGVLAHEMSHIVLRHGTKQLTAQNLVQIPLVLASALTGHSLWGQLAQIGIGLGANSVLLKFSRSDEEQADYNGAEIMAEAGYNPVELGRFFEKLESQGGRESAIEQFLSDHPNPGNRVAAIEEEIRQMPRRSYVEDQTGQFQRIKDVVRHLPAPPKVRGDFAEAGTAPPAPTAPPSDRLRLYQGRTFSLQYPENWRIFGEPGGATVTIAAVDGVVQGRGGQTLIGYGLQVNRYSPEGREVELNRDTQALIQQLKRSNTDARIGRDTRSIEVAREPALLTTLYSRSPYRGEQEVDALVTVARPDGLFYIVFIAPQSLFDQVQGTFEDVVRSVRFF
jgi:Zn-dependent protease with chaperone function